MLVGGLDQVRKRLKQQLGQYEYKQRCESLMIQSSNYYATTENSSFKCQEYDTGPFEIFQHPFCCKISKKAEGGPFGDVF